MFDEKAYQRCEKAYQLRSLGASYIEIAKYFNFSGTRARQLVQKFNYLEARRRKIKVWRKKGREKPETIEK